MSITDLKDKLPEYAKDIKLNLSNLFESQDTGGLTVQQTAAIALSCAYASKDTEVINMVSAYAKEHLTDSIINGCKIAAIIMAMNNFYYRALHLASDKEMSQLPAKLRMNSMANSGMEKVDFELCSLAVSVWNGCGMCIDAHIATLSKHSVTKEAIQTALRVPAVLHAATQALAIARTE